MAPYSDDLYEINDGKVYKMDILPDPIIEKSLTKMAYDSSDEEKFDESVHLGKKY